MTPIKLYVDLLSDDGSIGTATSTRNFSYNIRTLNLPEDFYNKITSDNAVTNYGVSGTYLVLVSLSLDNSKFQMILIESKHPKLWEYVDNHLDELSQSGLRLLHSEIEQNYDRYFGQTTLVLGEAPLLEH